MSSSAETNKGSFLDVIIIMASLAVLVAGIWGYYYFENEAIMPVRVLGLLAVVGLALVVLKGSTHGKVLFQYLKDSDIERRKVVWPTRQETIAVTGMVLVVTIIISIILYIIDLGIGAVVRWLIG